MEAYICAADKRKPSASVVGNAGIPHGNKIKEETAEETVAVLG